MARPTRRPASRRSLAGVIEELGLKGDIARIGLGFACGAAGKRG